MIAGGAQAAPSLADRLLKRAGDWLSSHQQAVRRLQWCVIAIYAVLIVGPVLLPLPDNAAHVWNNLTLFAQFVFWGLWWPIVLASMMLVGRVWCGLLCPEGALSEFASRHGRGAPAGRFVTWRGWPFVAFALLTIYGQMVSVYQYPGPVLLVLGGSTLGAMAVGYLYGRSKRVWCRYLCPVSGVFGLLTKLAPIHFRVDRDAYERSRRAHERISPVNCAPLVAISQMRGSSGCHMCGRCSGFRGAITLARRSPNEEIVNVAGEAARPVETLLIVFGLMGIAAGAFHWSASPWFVAVKQAIAEWLVDRGLVFALDLRLPWWLLTNYPDRNDVMTLLDGAVMLAYVGATALAIGGLVAGCLAAAAWAVGWSAARFHHLAQSLIPLAGCGVILGLSALTVTMLRGEGFTLGFADPLRAALLAGASLWSLWLAWLIAGRYSSAVPARIAAVASIALAVGVGDLSWALLFWLW
ncbi:MAG TPA: 4Fe-4S binding protein [Pseudorhodoplanes sp.]|nr:4Fe-4S binding protein [Pseudorhodoplanes sp.]